MAPPTEEEIRAQHFNDLAAEIGARFQVFAEDPLVMRGFGTRFFWQSAHERLHSYDVPSRRRVDYAFPVAPDVYRAFEAGTDAVVTAEYSDEAWQLSAYAVDEPDVLLDSIAWPAPPDVGGFYDEPPIAIDDRDVYLLDAQYVIHRWRPGAGAPEPVVSFADRGLVLNAMPQFSVHGEDIMVLATDIHDGEYSGVVGRALWHLGLGAGATQKVAEFVNDFCLHPGGALYHEAPDEGLSGLLSYSTSERRTEDLSAVLKETAVRYGDKDISSYLDDRHSDESLFTEYDCQPGGLSFENWLGSYFFDRKTREMQVLHLKRHASHDDESSTDTSYIDFAVVEGASFIKMNTCKYEDSTYTCTPSAIYMRDLYAP